MGLVAFAGQRIGFWVVARGIRAADELPTGTAVAVSGEASDDRRALIVAAEGAGGGVAWAVVLHADGAAVLLEWRGTLVAALGERVVRIDGMGSITCTRVFPSPVASAQSTPGGLLLVGAGEAWLVDEALVPVWRAPLEGEAFHVLSADADTVRLAAMGADDWREFVLDARTGMSLPAPARS